jgi:hypothetical protein
MRCLSTTYYVLQEYINTVFKNNMNSVLPWLKWLVTDLSPRRAMLDTRAVFVEFVDEVAVRQVFLLNTLVFPCHYYFVTNASYSYFVCLMSTLYILITDSVSKQNASFLWKMRPWTLIL